MIQGLDIMKIRQQLKSELQRFNGNSHADAAGNQRRSGANLDRDDLAHNYSVRERQRALNDVEQLKKKQIEKALERLARGTYGQCAGCGNLIESGRLEIMPYAAFCISCQKEREQS
jgi:RNA polymerase-binding transcription factor DksA